MTEDIRDAAQGNPGSADAATENTPDSAAETFAAETAAAEALPVEPVVETVDFRDKWLRAEAEIQNTRRRAAREREDSVRSAEDRILLDLIECLDDVERALAAMTPEQAADAWTQGVLLTANRMRDALSRRGVRALESVGKPFDPSFHEALLEVPAPEGFGPGQVVQEVQKGYARGERALRAARVVVARMD
ncbi:MAG: nucleotide exchange factor GrpE [Candidatus Eisenbacteria bacterium]|nr:nucleotide exchange factor GrpE [Candidatus Eisenbacteria bacterium]